MKAPGRAGVLLAAAVGAAACAGEAPGFDAPASALHDTVADVYFVSNSNGSPLAKDDNGYIARVQPDGGMERRWIAGGRDGVTLHAPKGLAIVGDVLWVADIDELRAFDRTSGAPLAAVPIPGASCLVDVSAAPDGTLYCTDSGQDAAWQPTGTDAIWMLPAGPPPTAGGGWIAPPPRVLARGADLGQPRGIVALATGVYVVNWRDGAFFQIDRAGRRTDLGKAPMAQLDGLVRAEAGPGAGAVWLATSRAGACLYRFDMHGACTTLPARLEQPADCGLDARRARLLVPLSTQDRLELLQQ